jgi:hypothetical protein
MLCGFPLGVKATRDLYDQGRINKDQLVRLSGFCNNPSAAFVISGVGLGIFGSMRIGIYLLISCIISAFFCGIFFREKLTEIIYLKEIPRQSFDLVESIKSAGLTSITISSYVIFFSSLINAINSIVNSSYVSSIIASLFELCSAVERIGSSTDFSFNTKQLLIAFALGFSGLSVHLQAFSFFPKDALKAKYLLIKLTQGIVCAIITNIFILLQ